MSVKKTADKPNVLIVDDIHEVFLNMLSDAGISYLYRPDIGLEEAKLIIAGFDGLVVRSKFKVGKDLLDVAPLLRVIARGGAGMDNIDEYHAHKHGVTLLNAPEGNRDAVGEHMVGMLLALMNNYVPANTGVREGEWLREKNRGEELMGKTVAIIGYGNNGQAMARKLSGFDVRVLAYDRYKKDFSNEYVEQVALEDVYAQADVLSLHVPLTSETRNMVDDGFIAQFKKEFYFLNGARGEIVSIPAVLNAVNNNKIKGAAFDVLPIEGFPALYETPWYGELAAHEKVLLTPHVAGWTFQSYYKIAQVLAKKLIAFYGRETI